VKLQQFGKTGRILHWYSDYLLGRKQRVVVDGVSSSYLDVTSGVPQGSIVGPLLFLVYVKVPLTQKNVFSLLKVLI
jgi:hypothetical protein